MEELDWRPLSREDRSAASDLIDRAFGLSPPSSYLIDFPVWDPGISPSPNRFQIGGFRGPRMVSTASLRISRYRFGNGSDLPLGLIGAVATDPGFSGRGYASEAIDRILREGSRRKIEDFALWGSESPLYRNRGFVFGGKQVRVRISEIDLPAPGLEGFEIRTGWDSAVAEWLLRRKTGILYSDSDVLWLSRHPNVEWRTLWIDGRCLAYCAWNRGIDLPKIVHELEGEPEACSTILDFLRLRYPDLEWIAHPDRIRELGIRGAFPASESLAQFRLGSTAKGPLSEDRLGEIWFSGMDSC